MSRLFIGGAVVVGAATIALGFEPSPVPSLAASGVSGSPLLVSTAEPAMTSGGLEAASISSLPRAYASLLSAKHWLNTPPLTAAGLRGKVVLVNFWTYSCINSLRPLPYLSAWAEKYRGRGLIVVGVHAPEFGFEKDPANVRQAIAGLGVNYPVVLDDNLAIWRKFGNRGWPGFYFVGADGRIRHQSLGEGNYEGSERLIQRLLAEAGGGAGTQAVTAVRGEGAQAAPDWENLRSPETYIGYASARNFVSPGGAKYDAPSPYASPATLSLNHWSLTGGWTVGAEFASLGDSSGAIRYRFHARDLHLVLGAPPDGRQVRFRIRIDGAVPGVDHGSDVDADGWGTVQESRLYQLVRQTGPVQDRTFEIEFSDPGVRAYAFTFG
jgi:thiol-disulfide isomerase/thioredoxin